MYDVVSQHMPINSNSYIFHLLLLLQFVGTDRWENTGIDNSTWYVRVVVLFANVEYVYVF